MIKELLLQGDHENNMSMRLLHTSKLQGKLLSRCVFCAGIGTPQERVSYDISSQTMPERCTRDSAFPDSVLMNLIVVPRFVRVQNVARRLHESHGLGLLA